MNRTLGWICFAVALTCCATAHAQTNLKAVCGWGDAYRIGRWTPVFVTVTDPHTRAIDLEVHGAYGVHGALLTRQRAVAEPRPTVYALLFPVNADLANAEVIIRDAQTGKTLATQVLQDPGAFSPAGHIPLHLLGATQTLIGIGGNIGDALLLQTQLSRTGLPAGVLNEAKLPAGFMGYEGISVLVLAAANLRQLDGDQQRGIADWIQRGGNLVLIPGVEPLPQEGPIINILPCEIGVNRTVAPPPGTATTRPDSTLAGNPHLNARQLSPRPDAQAVALIAGESPHWTAYSAQVGLGRVTVVPVDISSLTFDRDSAAVEFWRLVLSGMVPVPGPPRVTEIQVSDGQEEIMPAGPKRADTVGRGTAETLAIRNALGVLNAVQPVPEYQWPGLLLALSGIFALLGPVDSILLMRLGQPPRHWLTVIGWLGLFGSGVGYLSTRWASGSIHTQTLSIIDQADGSQIAGTDLVAIRSDTSRHLAVSLEQNEWWEPANQASQNFPADHFWDVDFHQEQHGNFPQSLSLIAGEPRAFRGERAVSGPALIQADLSLAEEQNSQKIVGKLTNLSKSSMDDLWIAAAGGTVHLRQGPLAPGESASVDLPLAGDPVAFAGLPKDVLDISSDRNDLIRRIVQSGGMACVYCRVQDAPAIQVIDGVAAEQRHQILRAVMPLRPSK